MTKSKIIIGLLILSSLPSLAALGKKISGPGFDADAFIRQNAETAGWLCVYDAVAWRTTDVLLKENEEDLKRLGGEWFCFQTKDENWHAVYGKYENDKMNVVLHYLIDPNFKISRTSEPIEATFLDLHARALITANNQYKEIRNSVQLRFNQYIKQNEDKTFTVWIFPAFQPDGFAIYGGEFIYKIDPAGTKVLEDNSYYQGKFKGFKADGSKEVWLDYTELEKPTLGGVFFVLYYKKYFKSIFLDYKYSFSTLFKSGENEKETYIWLHKQKDVKKEVKKAGAKDKKKVMK